MFFIIILITTPVQAINLGKWLKGKAGSVINLVLALSDKVEVERFVGQQTASKFEEDFGISTDPGLQARVQNIVLRLAPLYERKGIKYDFKILNSYEVNAYALPGGFGYINRGLLTVNGLSDDELASVISHELTHIYKRHGWQQYRRNLVFSAAFGDSRPDNESTLRTVAEITSQLLTSGRSREEEKDADLIGIENAQEAGFDPAGGLTFMRRLETISEKDPEPFQRLFATHPPTQTRSEYLKDYLIESRYGTNYRTQAKKGDHRILGEYRGVPAYSNDEDTGSGENLEYQCVAYVKRFYEQVYHLQPPLGPVEVARNAYDLWGGREDFTRISNSTNQAPVPDDILCFVGGPHGHVAIVTNIKQIDVAAGIYEVEIIEQNFHQNTCFDSLQMKVKDGLFYMVPRGRYYVQGWLHYQGNNSPQPQPPILVPGKPQPAPGPENEIPIEKGPEHLGDDQQESRTIWLNEFILDAFGLGDKQSATLRLDVKGSPRKDPIISINRHQIGFAVTKTDQWETFPFSFDPKILKPGKNLIDIETVIPNLRQGYDDCEFRNVILILR